MVHHSVRRGFATKRYSVTALVNALQLPWSIRNLMQTSITDVVRMAWKCSLRPEFVADLEADLQSGMIEIPQRTVLANATIKLDILMSVYERTLLQSHVSDRYLLADASELKGVNYFIMREDTFKYAESTSVEDRLASDLQSAFSTRHLPLSTTGLGAGTEMHKGSNLCHAMVLESGSPKAFMKKRSEVRAFCSDQGVESKLADCSCALSPTISAAQWEAMLEEARRASLSSAPSSYLLPLAIYIPDCLHVLFGALEHSVTKTEEWTKMSSVLRCLSKFLSRPARRERFAEACLSRDDDKQSMQSYIGDITDWKWEYTAMFLLRVRDVVPLLVKHFQADIYIKGPAGCEALTKGEAALAMEVAEAIQTPHLVGKCEVLRCICFTLDRHATRLEGCRCHEAVLDDRSQPWSHRVDKYRKSSRGCFNKGRRAIELALGLADTMVASLRSASDSMLRTTYAAMTSQARQAMQQLELSIKASLCHRIALKLSYWQSLPHKIIGVYGCVVGLCSLDKVIATITISSSG